MKHTEATAAAILESISDGYFALDEAWRFTYVNRAAQEVLGRSREELLGLSMWTEYPGLAGTEFEQVYRRARSESRHLAFTGYYPDHDRWYEVNAYPSESGLTVYFRNVTERIMAEQAIRETAERYRTLFDSIDEGFCIVDMIFDKDGRPSDYRFLETNPAFERHTGLTNAVGKRIRELAPDLEAHWFDIYGNVARTGRSVRFVNEAQALGGRWFDVNAFRLGDEGSTRVACLFNDITARRRMEQQLGENEQRARKLSEQLAEADKRKDEFLAVLAHELRNPLAPLRNGLEIMRLTPDDSAAMARIRSVMERQLGNMVHLLDDLLDIARIGAAKLELRRARVPVSDIVHSAVETARPVIEAAGQHLEVSIAAEPLYVEADITRLAQVVANLLNNSAKYTQPGGSIRLSVEREGDEVVFVVQDNGIGIPPDKLETVFEMFTQVDRRVEREAGGLGIGLALVKGLVELHGGTVLAQSEGPRRGSRFIVRLPALAPVHGSMERGDAPSADENKLRILIVDDNRDAASSTALMLSLIGYETKVVHDGPTAISMAESLRPDVVLMDIGMPEMNGYEATRRIREQAWSKDMSIIALTGWGQATDKMQSEAAGCDGHLVKPVRLSELTASLQSIVRERSHG